MVAIGAHFFALRGRQAHVLHRTDQGARQREVLRAVRGLRRRQRRHDDRRRLPSTPTAPIICATAEIVANLALREGPDSDIGQVVMDEFHFYSEPDRGWAWQVPAHRTAARAVPAHVRDSRGRVVLLRGPHSSHRPPTTVVSGTERPVPLMFSYSQTTRSVRRSKNWSPPTRPRCTSCTSRRPPRSNVRRH